MKVGDKFITNEGYEISVVEICEHRRVNVMFKNGYVKNVSKSALTLKTIKNPFHPSVNSVGYVGIGKYKPKIGKQETKPYSSWRGIMDRGYNSKFKEKYLTYKDVTVCEEWHNFQNFGDWFEENYKPEYMEGWHLDKDILVKGNKIYSPETCCFVPREINVLFCNSHKIRGQYPIGVSFCKFTNKFESNINKGGRNRTKIGRYDTPEEAFQAYKEVKERWIKEVADKWKGLIEEKVYQSMINYTVEIMD